MKPSDWLLLFAACEGAADGLDPVRIQQGLFLFSRCPGVPARSKYVFEPGSYGPLSGELYADLDRLTEEGALESVPVRGKRWSRYRPSDLTFEQGHRILKQAEDEHLLEAARELFEIKRYVSSVGFGQLLDRICSEHPGLCVKSAFRSAA